MNVSKLHDNQKLAISCSQNNDYKSGIHFHATGTGKSWIALQIILDFHFKYPNAHVLWLCEKKSILMQQFNRNTIKEKGYHDIFQKFLVLNYTEKKPKDWYSRFNSAAFWKKALLLVINRAFLVSQNKYQKINIPIDLIIHDECHTIQNKTTQQFYTYMKQINPKIRCLGFSATPYLEKEPFNVVLSKYTIYDAYCDKVIVPPKIKWIKTSEKLSDYDIMLICKKCMECLYYKKIIVWCGTISKCYELATLWKSKFTDFLIYVDTSKDSDQDFKNYSEKETHAILFCAAKHREGSDIKNLDGCIFLDKVENRNPKTFVQCIGRVLRKDVKNNKKYGLILDLKASSCIKICDRMNNYLNCNIGFPWKYQYRNILVNGKKVILHGLRLRKPKKSDNKPENYTVDDLIQKFVNTCPQEEVYLSRLQHELDLLCKKKLINYLIRAVDILEITNYIPHVTRGSCGSSLVCYLLGISNVDPIKHQISFSRFLNQFRDNLPDIDLDFPHYLRDEVFLKLELQWPNQVARISNKVHWHEKSALREAIRKIGINKQISKGELHKFISELPSEKKKLVKKYTQELDNTFRHYSLHCGGIIFFHEGIPPELVLKRKTLNQIVYDKHDVSKTKNFKIDVLSSRGLSQLIDICGKDIDFSNCPYDEKTYTLLQQGNNIGITLAESPLMRKALMMVKPKSIKDIAICLAIIRPAAKDARIPDNEIDYDTQFIFDDDAIVLLSKYLNIDEDLADKYRRCLAKNKWKHDDKQHYQYLLSKLSPEKEKFLNKQLQNLRKYSFCKSHSYSYAQLVYKLAYQKAHHPEKFWKSTIKNVRSSYRKWVHLYEAHRNGVNIKDFMDQDRDVSVYAEKKQKLFYGLNHAQQIVKYGYWHMKHGEFFPNCYFYNKGDIYYYGGLIASCKIIHRKPQIVVCFVGVSPGKFIEISMKNKYFKKNMYGIKGRAKLKNKQENTYEAHIAVFY